MTAAVDQRRVWSIALAAAAGTVAAAGTLAVTVAGFTLSFDAIRVVGQAAHIRAALAWLLPVSVDGAMAVATVTAVVLRRMSGRTGRYPWAVVVTGALISVACNGLHALGDPGQPLTLPDGRVRFAVSAIPAVMLALSVHLLVMLVEASSRAGARGEASKTSVSDVDDEEPPASLGSPDRVHSGPVQPATDHAVQLDGGQPAPGPPVGDRLDGVHRPADEAGRAVVDPPPASSVDAGPPPPAGTRAEAIAREHLRRDGRWPTTTELAGAAQVSRGTAGNVLKALRSEPAATRLHVVAAAQHSQAEPSSTR